MSEQLANARRELAIANRILANEGIIDAFGHISMRHPERPDRYLISRYRASELVEPEGILEMTLDSVPVENTGARLYSECVIHGEIYKARPDVLSVCHHHAPAIMPYAIAGVAPVAVSHLGSTFGDTVPFWDSRDEFGDTKLLLTTPQEGASLARALGPHWVVLLRRHGATVVGRSLHESVFRSVYQCRDAEFLTRTMAVGKPGPLTKGEIALCAEGVLNDRVLWRAWDYWTGRLAKAEYAAGVAPIA